MSDSHSGYQWTRTPHHIRERNQRLDARILERVLKWVQQGQGRERMRITISHTRSKEEVMRSVDRSLDDLFQGIGIIPLQFVEEQRSWQQSTLIFSISAKMGILSTPIKGTIEVTDKDLTIDADLGWLERLIPASKARRSITNQVRGLLT